MNIVLILTFAWLLLSLAFIYILVRSVINGAVYLPTPKDSVARMIEFAKVEPGERAADLGSGDGRILIALARAGADAYGYEINPLLVWRSRTLIKKMGLEDKIAVRWQSFWREDFSSFDIVTVYGIDYIMKPLEKKLQKELKPGARVISHVFRFPDWPIHRSEGAVHLYRKS